MKKSIHLILVVIVTGITLALLCTPVFAHCDTMDGPVVKAAQKALETSNVNFVLIWVQQKDEPEIKKAFEKTLAVRKLSTEAKELADMYFLKLSYESIEQAKEHLTPVLSQPGRK
jgi:hypothetical protein